MPGPAPKNPATRQRANKASTAATLETGRLRFALPALPEGDWHPRALAFWSKVWKSEMAGEFVEADVEQLYMLAVLVNDFWNGDHAVAAEIRLQGQRFGLSPLDRRRLDWTLSDKPAVSPIPAAPAKARFDPRKVLEMRKK